MTIRSIIIAVCIMVSALCPSCRGGKKAPAPPQRVEALTLARGTIERAALFTGNIVAEDAFDVFPRASGKVSKKLLKEGDPVKRGQAILLVDRDEVGYSFKQMPVVSPIDGEVGRIAVDVGTNVEVNTPVVTVVHPGTMRVKLDVPERYLSAIRPGTEVSMWVDYLDGERFVGTIATSSPVIDQKTRTGRVEVEIEGGDGRLKHGMFGRMDLVVERRDDAVIAPLGAISWEGEKQFVYKVEEGKAKRAEVKAGLRSATHVEILGGAAEGEAVAVGNLFDLKDGEAVEVTTGGLKKGE